MLIHKSLFPFSDYEFQAESYKGLTKNNMHCPVAVLTFTEQTRPTWEKIFAVGATLLSTILYNMANNLSSGNGFGPRR